MVTSEVSGHKQKPGRRIKGYAPVENALEDISPAGLLEFRSQVVRQDHLFTCVEELCDST